MLLELPTFVDVIGIFNELPGILNGAIGDGLLVLLNGVIGDGLLVLLNGVIGEGLLVLVICIDGDLDLLGEDLFD